MRLADFLHEHRVSSATFAQRVGVTRQAMWRYRSGERRPEWDVLERIALASGGLVTPNDFLEQMTPVDLVVSAEPERASA